VLAFVVRVALLLGIAELSYRHLEMPVRRGALARGWRRVRDGDLPQPSPALLAGVAAVAVVVMFTGFRVITAPAPAAAAGGMTAEQFAALAPARAPLEKDFARMAAAEDLDPRAKVTAFGDSVMLGASGALESDTFNLDLHAKVATQAADVLASIAEQVSSGQLRDTVVLHVGNNGIVTEEQLRAMLAQLSGAQRVVLVNVRVPRAWMQPNNALIASVAKDYPNVTVADWAKASEDHRDYMVKDGVHLTGKGAAEYTRVIAEAAGVQPT
jgi:lysophospholipase L1-like esterase